MEARIDIMEDIQKGRHEENGRKLDKILHEVQRTNGRVTTLEVEGHERTRKIDSVCVTVSEVRREQEKVHRDLSLHTGQSDGKQSLVRRLDMFLAPLISGLVVGIAVLLVKLIWHV